MKAKNRGFKAFKVFQKDQPDNAILVFAKRHSRAKSLGLKHFPGEKYNDMRATRETSWDLQAQQHGNAEVITHNRQLPDGLKYYPEKRMFAIKADSSELDESLARANKALDAHSVKATASTQEKPDGVFSKIMKRLFG